MNELGRSLKYDPIVADALFGDSRRKGGVSAERELMAAILADAIDCYWKYFNGRDGRSMRLFRDADRKSTRLNSSHIQKSRMPSSA